MKKWIATLVIVAVAPLSVLAQAAFTPNRTVTIVVPFPPGGGTDALARILAEKLTQQWKQHFPEQHCLPFRSQSSYLPSIRS